MTLLPLGPHQFALSGLVVGTSYKVQISSVNEIGESSLSDSLIFLFALPPSSPLTLALKATEGEITATWNVPTSYNGDYVNGYILYISDDVGGDPQYHDSTEGTPEILSYVFTSDANNDPLQCGSTYSIAITAVNLAGESTPTESSILVGQVPSAPVNLKVVSCVPGSTITVAWEPPADTG